MKNYSELCNYPPFTHGPNYGLVQGLIGPIARVNEQPLYQLSVTEDHVNEVLRGLIGPPRSACSHAGARFIH